MTRELEPALRLDAVSKAACDDAQLAERHAIRDALFGRPRGLRHGERWAVKDVSISVGRGETVGILGAKVGDATLLARVMGGVLLPDAGRLDVRGPLAFWSQLGKGFKPMLHVGENLRFYAVLMGAPAEGLDERCRQIISFADLGGSERRRLQDLTRAQVRALAFATLLHIDVRTLVLANVSVPSDDAAFHERASAALARRLRAGSAIVFTQRAQQLPEATDRLFVFKEGGLLSFEDRAAAIAYWELNHADLEAAHAHRTPRAEPEDGDDEPDEGPPAEPPPPCDELAAHVRDVRVRGMPSAINETSFVFDPGEVVTVEFTLAVHADLGSPSIVVQLNAAEVRQPLAVGAVAPPCAMSLVKGKSYRVAIDLAIPRLQRGRFGVTASLVDAGKRPVVLKLFAFGTRTDEPPGTATVFDVRAARVTEER